LLIANRYVPIIQKWNYILAMLPAVLTKDRCLNTTCSLFVFTDQCVYGDLLGIFITHLGVILNDFDIGITIHIRGIMIVL